MQTGYSAEEQTIIVLIYEEIDGDFCVNFIWVMQKNIIFLISSIHLPHKA